MAKTPNKPTNETTQQAAVKPPQAHPHHLNWLERYVPYILITTGLLGGFASLMLIVERLQYLKNPMTKLGCDLNPVVGCGANIDIWQSSVFFGIPNEVLGLISFVVLVTVGVGILAGAKFRRWFWLGLQLGILFGLLFVHWFIFQSIFVIKHLCPYCMLTWLAIIIGGWYLILYGIRAEHVRLHGSLAKANHFIQKHHADIVIVWILSIVGLILYRFWYYWQTLI